MRVFITGGMGFIGRHLAGHLLAGGHHVTVYDNMSNRPRDAPEDPAGARFVEGDILDLELLSDAMKGHDVSVHLAAKISVSASEEDEAEISNVNVNGSLNVAEGCVKNSVPRLIVMSSATVYGQADRDTACTEESPKNPISAYGRSKSRMEDAVTELSERSGLSLTIMRLFNAYGPGQSDAYAGVIQRFADCARRNLPVRIFGDGEQTRDFVHVDDIARIMEAAIAKNPDAKTSVYNIGTGKPVTINELARLVFATLGKSPKITHGGQAEGDIRFSCADVSRLKNQMGYVPETELTDGIRGILSRMPQTGPDGAD